MAVEPDNRQLLWLTGNDKRVLPGGHRYTVRSIAGGLAVELAPTSPGQPNVTVAGLDSGQEVQVDASTRGYVRLWANIYGCSVYLATDPVV